MAGIGFSMLALTPIILTGCLSGSDNLGGYDPLVTRSGEPEHVDTEWLDAARDRTLPVRVYLPENTGPAPVVIFSHGLGGSRQGSRYLGQHLAKRGYAAVFLQHPGSDESVWRGVPLAERRQSMQEAANAANFRLRAADVAFALDELNRQNGAAGRLRGRLDLDRIGMSGHSFGAVTTQAVAGQSFPGLGQAFTDSRIRAAVLYSPSPPHSLAGTSNAFGSVNVPWLLMTGTDDVAAIGNVRAEDRLTVFPALPTGSKYELVLDGAQHSAFSDGRLPGDRRAPNPQHHRSILALTTAFWDAYLKGDQAARAWLDGEGPRRILDPKDRWQGK